MYTFSQMNRRMATSILGVKLLYNMHRYSQRKDSDCEICKYTCSAGCWIFYLYSNLAHHDTIKYQKVNFVTVTKRLYDHNHLENNNGDGGAENGEGTRGTEKENPLYLQNCVLINK